VDKKRSGAISDLMARRSNLVELFLVAILLALSLEFIAGSLMEILPLSPQWILATGLVLGLIALGYSLARLFGVRRRSQTYKGFFTYHKQINSLIRIPRYRYSEKLFDYLRGAFSENEALKAMWDKEPLADVFKLEVDGKIARRSFRSVEFIIEATEYFFINELSLHLSSYFNTEVNRGKRLTVLSRNDIPDVLLSNRFLEMFSRPMEERPQFIERFSTRKHEPPGEVVYAMGKGGAIYDRFDLTLPANSRVKRLAKNSLEVETSRFRLISTVNFNAINTFIPFEFHKYILDVDTPLDISDFRVEITIDVRFKFGALLSLAGWDYYRWVDSFLERFRDSFSEEAFFESIGWEQALTVLDFICSREADENAV